MQRRPLGNEYGKYTNGVAQHVPASFVFQEHI